VDDVTRIVAAVLIGVVKLFTGLLLHNFGEVTI
jgi:hypothetical protein